MIGMLGMLPEDSSGGHSVGTGQHSKTLPAAVLMQKVAPTTPRETSIIQFILLMVLYAFDPWPEW